MKRAIITGGTGFIGKQLLEVLFENDVEVLLLVRDKHRVCNVDNKKVSVIQYNPERIEDVHIPQHRYDVFYHLAWGGVSAEKKNDIDLQISNIANSVKAMRFAYYNNCCRFIGAGTVAEYVFCRDVMDVNDKQSPNDMYGASKTATHYFLDVISRNLGIAFIWAVLPSTYGEGRTSDNIVTYTIRSLLRNEKPQYGDLKQMWDFLYVKEVARALYLIGEKGKDYKTYGIGSGNYKPLKEYIEMIRDMINPTLPLGIGEIPEMSARTFSSCVNIDELTNDTGFIPEIHFEEGMKRTIEWYRMEYVRGTGDIKDG